MMNLKDKVILITGGTGSLGSRLMQYLLKRDICSRKIIIFSRDEFKQSELQKHYPQGKFPVRYFVGDVRDSKRLKLAFRGVNIIIHCAALKQVPSCEYNPFEAISTNIFGTQNIIESAIENEVEYCLFVSSDKAVNPVNLYGSTKMVAEKLIIQSNNYANHKTKFSCVRYGNVIESRGAIYQLFKEQAKTGTITITDERMTRFYFTLSKACRFVINTIIENKAGIVYIPKLPSFKIMDFKEVIGPDCKTEKIGIRKGEKIHEILISKEEISNTYETENNYMIVNPDFCDTKGLNKVKGDFTYSSENNNLTIDDLKKLMQEDKLI